jgi:hypothetical protein
VSGNLIAFLALLPCCLLPCCLLLIIMLSFFNWRAIIVTDFDKTAMKLLEVGSPLQTLTTSARLKQLCSRFMILPHPLLHYTLPIMYVME